MELGAQFGITHIHDASSAFILAVQALDARTTGTCCSTQTEIIEHGKAGRLQQEAGTHRLHDFGLFELCDVMAGPLQIQARSLSRSAVSDDGDGTCAH